MASKNINIALFLTINLIFFGFTMAQAPTCPRSSTQVENCVNQVISSFTSFFGGLERISLARICCFSQFGELDASVASVCICDAVKLVDPLFEQTDVFRRVTEFCAIRPPAGFRCA